MIWIAFSAISVFRLFKYMVLLSSVYDINWSTTHVILKICLLFSQRCLSLLNVISSLKTTLYDVNSCISKLLDIVDNLGYYVSTLHAKQHLYVLGKVLNLTFIWLFFSFSVNYIIKVFLLFFELSSPRAVLIVLPVAFRMLHYQRTGIQLHGCKS
jgi:hypothetical protein